MNEFGTAPGLLTIDLSAVARNYAAIKTLVGPGCAVAGVVKADAYGLGMAAVAPVLERAGCDIFFVATLEEAIALRQLTGKRIYCLGGLYTGAEQDYIAHAIAPVLGSLAEMARWRNAALACGKALPCALHFDTGMNRLGMDKSDTHEVLAGHFDQNGLNIDLVMTHFASADAIDDNGQTAGQAAQFDAICAKFPNTLQSLANSSGLFRDARYRKSLVRPGIALYGLNPNPWTDNPMEPVVSLSVRLLQVREAAAGETVGYGASYTTDRPTRIGTVALGYADGFLRSGGNRATLYLDGHPCPVIGRVSMDLVTVDLGSSPAQPGAMLVVIGPHQDADALAAQAGTIGYEILTNLGRRWHRKVIGDQI